MSSSLGRTIFYTVNAILLLGVSIFQVSGPTLLCDTLFVEKCGPNASALMRVSSIATAFWATHIMMEIKYAYATVIASLIGIGSSIMYAFTNELKLESRIVLAIVGGLLAGGYTFFDLYKRSPSTPAAEVEVEEPTKLKRSRRDVLNAA